jgi:hypothetical protein
MATRLCMQATPVGGVAAGGESCCFRRFRTVPTAKGGGAMLLPGPPKFTDEETAGKFHGRGERSKKAALCRSLGK